MKLFIPRKQRLSSLSEEANDLIREDLLAVEKWANQRGISAEVKNSGFVVVPDNVFVVATFDTVAWDYFSIVDMPNSRLVVPEDGIYFVSVSGQFTGLTAAFTVDARIGGGLDHTHAGPGPGYNNISLGDVVRYSKGTNVQVLVRQISGAPANWQLWEFSLTKLFDVPSKVQ